MPELPNTSYDPLPFDIPQRYVDFSATSISLLEQAHRNSLEVTNGTMQLSIDSAARRAYFERRDAITPRHDYDLIAVHLGNRSLTICIAHFHQELPSDSPFETTTIVFAHGEANAYFTRVAGHIHDQSVTDSETTAEFMTQRLVHAVGAIGIKVGADTGTPQPS